MWRNSNWERSPSDEKPKDGPAPISLRGNTLMTRIRLRQLEAAHALLDEGTADWDYQALKTKLSQILLFRIRNHKELCIAGWKWLDPPDGGDESWAFSHEDVGDEGQTGKGPHHRRRHQPHPQGNSIALMLWKTIRTKASSEASAFSKLSSTHCWHMMNLVISCA